MLVYRIILNPGFPMNIGDFRDAAMIPLNQAHWILDSFPFEEPEDCQCDEDDPAPHILFINIKKCCFLMITYSGKGCYQLAFCSEGKDPDRKMEMKTVDVKEAISLFWDTQLSPRQIRKLIFGSSSFWDDFF